MSVNALVFLSFSVIAPIKNAASTKPKRNPNPGLKMYVGPPPAANTGTPTSPMHRYTITLIGASFAPSRNPAINTKNHCNVKCMVYIGSGISILINAPTAISAAKSAHVVSSFVFNFIFARSFVLLNIHAIITSFFKKEKPSSMKLTFLCSFRCDSKH